MIGGFAMKDSVFRVVPVVALCALLLAGAVSAFAASGEQTQ